MKKMVNWRLLSLLALVLTLAMLASSCACGPCGGDEGGEGGAAGDAKGDGGKSSKKAEKEDDGVEKMVALMPADVDASIVIKSWTDLIKGLEVAEKKFGDSFPVSKAMKDIEKESGLDLTDPKSLEKNGLDPKGSAGAMIIEENVLLIMPVKNEKDLIKSLEKEAKEDENLEDKLAEEKVGSDKIHYMLKKGAKEPRKGDIEVAFTIKDNFLVMFPADSDTNDGDPKAILTDVLKLKADKSLGKAKDYKTLTSKLGDDQLLYAYINLPLILRREAKNGPEADRKMMQDIADRSGWIGVGSRIDDKGLDSRAYALGDKDTVGAIVKSLTARSDFDALADGIEGKPMFVARVSLDADALLKEIGKLNEDIKKDIDRGLKDAGRDFGIDIRKDLLPALDGNIALVAYDADPRAISQMDLGGMLEKGQATIMLGVKDQKKLVDALTPILKNFGAKPEEKDGVTTFTIGEGKKSGSIVIGKKVAVVGATSIGADKLAKMAKGKGDGAKGVFAQGASKDLLSGKTGTGVAVDVQKVLQAMGDQAQGPEADALKPLKSWAFNLAPEDDGASLTIDVRFK